MELDEMEEDYQRRQAAKTPKPVRYGSGAAGSTDPSATSLAASGCALTRWQEHYMMFGCAGRGLIVPEDWDNMI